MKIKLLFTALLFSITLNVECAKILAIFHFPSKSHHILGSSLLQALAKRGHQVTMLSPYPLKAPLENYEDIDLPGCWSLKKVSRCNKLAKYCNKLSYPDNNIAQAMQQQNVSVLAKMSSMMSIIDKINEHFLNHQSLKKLIESKRTFDVVIQCYFGYDAYLALPYIFEASSIAFSTIGSNMMINQLTGNSAPYSYVPNIFPSLSDEMTFLQRVTNTLCIILSELYYHLYMAPEQQRILQKYFPQSPSAPELAKNVSLVLLNSHYSIESPRPHVPNMIQVGGLHVEEPKELKGDLKKFMDSAVDGVIFFSFGSNVQTSELPKDKIDAIIESFAELPMKVLWKFEADSVPNLPSNVKIGKWLPQRDILAHPNTKLFITHGGLLSTTESIYHGVPMVGIPFFGDQDSNVNAGVEKGYVVKVPFLELSKETLTTAINEALSNPKYLRNVKQRSSVLRDQPLKPLDNAVFWVEYVIRHNGAHHLKTSAVNLRWYQYYLLDVLALLFAIILTVFGTIYLGLRMVFKLLKKMFGKSDSSRNIPKTKKKAKLS